MNLKQKLTLMVLPVVLGLIAFSFNQVYSTWSTVHEMQSFQEIAKLGVSSSSLVHELQKERGMSAGFVGSKGKKFTHEIHAQHKAVDQSFAAYEATLTSIDLEGLPAEVVTNIKRTSESMRNIEATRNKVESLNISVADLVGFYSQLNASFLKGIGMLSTTTENTELDTDVLAFTNFLQSKERAGIERAVLAHVFAVDAVKPAGFKKYITLKVEQATYLNVFNAVASDDFKNIVNTTVTGTALKNTEKYRTILESKTSGFNVNPTQWFSAQSAKIHLLKQAESKLAEAFIQDAEQMTKEALISLIIIIAITFLLLLVSFIVTRKVLNGILNSVNSAVDVSKAIAKGDLDNQVDTFQQDEIGVLMTTLDNMQTTFIEQRVRDQEAKVRDDKAKEQAADYEGQLDAIGRVMATIEFELDGTIRTANDNFLQTLGYTLSEIKGKHHSMLVEPEYKSSADYARYWEKLSDGEPRSEQFLRIGKGGKEVWIQASYNPIRDARGNVYKVVKFATDITEQKLAAQQLELMMSDANTTLQSVSEGDLTVSVAGTYQGELAMLQEAINSTVKNLNTTFSQIRDQADDVGGIAGELEVGNNTLNSRTQEQAAALEETAASLEEITGTVQQTADNSRRANQLSSEAREKAEQGGKVAEQAVTAMSEINSSSRKIADIIGVIDEIAFQTNLLALNAAVEAARAGEQGRGFAVVAGEVRTLAQRSAGAAKEIKGLINSSVENVLAGGKLVDESGKALKDIVQSVTKVNDLISEIAAASIEQTSGIDQINTAIAQLDSGTEQNAALVEESAAASERLNGQANSLREKVGEFKLGE